MNEQNFSSLLTPDFLNRSVASFYELVNDNINDNADISSIDEKTLCSQQLSALVNLGILRSRPEYAINDDDITGPNTFMSNARDLGLIYLQILRNDPLVRAVPMVSILGFGERFVKWQSVIATGEPDQYDDDNYVPLVQEQYAQHLQSIIDLQIALRLTLTQMHQKMGNLQSVEQLRFIKRDQCRQALIKKLRQVRSFGLPSHNIYGLFNSPQLPPAVTLKGSDWLNIKQTDTYQSVLSQLGDLVDKLAQQTDQSSIELSAFLILPQMLLKYLRSVAMKESGRTTLDMIKEQYPNLDIIFSPDANGYDPLTQKNNPKILLFSKTVTVGSGYDSSPFVSLVGLDYVQSPISVHQQTLKVEQELYVATTAGTILLSPKDVVVAKFDSVNPETYSLLNIHNNDLVDDSEAAKGLKGKKG